MSPLAEGAGDVGGTIAGALKALREQRLQLGSESLLVFDEAGMAGTAALRELLAAASSVEPKWCSSVMDDNSRR